MALKPSISIALRQNMGKTDSDHKKMTETDDEWLKAAQTVARKIDRNAAAIRVYIKLTTLDSYTGG